MSETDFAFETRKCPGMETAEFKQRMMPYAGQMYAVAFSILKKPSDAEDVVQDIFLKMWEKRRSMDSIANLKAYVLSAVRNKSLDMLAAGSRGNEGGVLECSDEGRAVEQVERKEAATRVLKLIAAMPEPQRTVISMHDVEGMGYDEISDLTGMSEGNLRTLLSRARKRIRDVFKR